MYSFSNLMSLSSTSIVSLWQKYQNYFLLVLMVYQKTSNCLHPKALEVEAPDYVVSCMLPSEHHQIDGSGNALLLQILTSSNHTRFDNPINQNSVCN